MTLEPDKINQKAQVLLDKAYNLMSNINTLEDGETFRSPANDKEVERARNILDEVSELNITAVVLMTYYDDMDELLENFEDGIDAGEEVDYTPINELRGEPAPIPEEPKTMLTQNDQKARDILEEIYGSWSEISVQNGQEYRTPNSRSEIRKSRKLIDKAKSLKIRDQDVKDRILELEGVLDSMGGAFPNYTWRIVISLIFSLGILGQFFYSLRSNVVTPNFEYNQEWFTTEKSGYLFAKPFVYQKKIANEKRKVKLKIGSELIPIAQINRRWVQVKTEKGQIGFVDYRILKGVHVVKTKKDAQVYKKIGGTPSDTISEGIQLIVLGRKTKKEQYGEQEYLKVKLEDGNIAWFKDYHLRTIMLDSIPEISMSNDFYTNKDVIDKNVLGKSLSEIENRYGPAFSHMQINNENLAYFRNVIIVENDTHHYHNSIVLNDSNIATGILYGGKGTTRMYDILPLANSVRGLELSRVNNMSFYRGNKLMEFEWWTNFKNKNWFTWLVYWGVRIFMIFAVIFLMFAIPRIVINPILQFFTFTRYLNNGLVVMIDSLIIIIASYFYLLYTFVVFDQWVLAVIATFVVTGILVQRHASNIWYNRCPNCFTMYSAIDEGTTYTGRDTNVTWGTWTKNVGMTETEYAKIYHTQTRSTKTTNTVDHYLDHRMCARCYYEWDVNRDEEEEGTSYL